MNPTRILIVDDIPDTVEILSRQLEQEGYEILKAYNGKDAVEMAQKNNPDLILMDIMMPDMDGFQATSRCKKMEIRGRFIPIIIVSATKDDTASIVRGLQCGADDYITLPCEKDILLARVRSMLRIKRMHDELNRANMMKTLFLEGMAHELRTPVNAIQGFTDLLLDDKTLTRKQRRDIRHIQNNENGLIYLMNEILNLSKIISGKVKVDSERFELGPVIRSCMSSISPRMRKKSVRLISNISKDVSVLDTDMSKLKKIVSHLLSNAGKFTEEGEIRVDCTLDHKGMVNISVLDTGMGIKSEVLPYIFEEFRHSDEIAKSDFKSNYGGSSLGLSISKRLAHLLGGDILVESTYGKGSRFTLVIPPKMPHEVSDE
ncbi:MAG: response regulator [Chlamydiae bacterium]|nr:response regulator [Chlamydiota bacterium]MBI3276858.1 response regulator [Chlamydiota bacterium]